MPSGIGDAQVGCEQTFYSYRSLIVTFPRLCTWSIVLAISVVSLKRPPLPHRSRTPVFPNYSVAIYGRSPAWARFQATWVAVAWAGSTGMMWGQLPGHPHGPLSPCKKVVTLLILKIVGIHVHHGCQCFRRYGHMEPLFSVENGVIAASMW